MGANTMMPQVATEDPVMEAIADFRETLNRLIDEQMMALTSRSLGAEVESQRAVVAEVTYTPNVIATATAEPAPPRNPEPKPRRQAPSTANLTPATPPTEPVREPPTAVDEESAPSSSRQRLDALARLLDKRAKQAGTTLPSTDPR